MEISYANGVEGLKPGRDNIVLIHGAGGSARSWQGLLSPLSRRYNTYALELPGHGDAPGPAGESIDELADWLKRALDQLIDGPVILTGVSMGGAIVQAVALDPPLNLAGLGLIATGAKLPVNPQVLEGLRTDFEATVKMIIKWCFFQASDELVELSTQLMRDVGPETLITDFQACAGFDLRERIHRINVPSLILVGAEDKMTPVKFARGLNETISDSRLEIIPAGGHMVHLEQVGRVRQLLTEFADRVFG